MSDSVRGEFRSFRSFCEVLTLHQQGKTGSGPAIGTHWGVELSKIIQAMKPTNGSKLSKGKLQKLYPAAYSVLDILTEKLGIRWLDSCFKLYGYMYSEEEPSEVFLWKGDADAVGWYGDSPEEGKYVIVDWKVLDILKFWERNADAYGKFLHQCLIYARLLQLHLNLNYLPHILLVPISGTTGQDIHPVLFCDFPEKCKETINSFEWSTTRPKPLESLTKKISVKWPLFKPGLKAKKVDKDQLLTEIFKEDAKVSDLLEVLGWPSLELTTDEINQK